ncbi:folate-binding protein 1-like isoform X2 [Miscanthus floridulus]|uniref:folate-binding protein 1-like isoform X2 n=1 Tax=Miscanthus floridulus TaxID=154761 RepID=UPI00345834FA
MGSPTRPRRTTGFALLLVLLFLSPLASAGQPKGVCVSPGGRFPAFSSEVRNLALTGEGSQECIHLWELLECSICDPRVGVRPGPPVVCASFCDMVFKACSESYFSVDMKTQALSPCGLGDILCGKAHKWVSNGTELCRLAGFSVQVSETSSGGVDDTFCYGGKASLDSISDSWTSSKDRPTLSGVASWDVQDFQRWAREMPVGERVSWAIGGMVLTAGHLALFFLSAKERATAIARSKLLLLTI